MQQTAANTVQNGSSEGHSIEEIDGLGSTYADRLSAVGIETTEDLRAAGAETVAEATEVSEERAETWIDRAQS